MDHRAIRADLQAHPFRPFRLRLVDGQVFEVLHPDFLLIAPGGRWLTHYNATSGEATQIEPMLIATIDYRLDPANQEPTGDQP
jgi:hypothetical protein